MSILALTGLLLAADAGGVEHSVTIAHGARELTARYRTRIDLATRTRGAMTPRGQGAVQCHWTATVRVVRRLDEAPSTERLVGAERVLSGARPGDCAAAAGAVRADVAARAPRLDGWLVAIAEADRRTLLAELEAATPRG